MNTIVALATPVGRSGIAVVRLSGEDSLSITKKLIADAEFVFKPRYATLKSIKDSESGEIIDEVLITYFQSPQSFTGEDVVEISCHGSPVVVRQIVDLCLKSDARLAQAGEFSLRALSNGRINLAQAEAIRDLIDAQTFAAARQSVRQLNGEISNRLQPIKDDLLNVIVVLESALEFVEDDLPEFQNEEIKNKLSRIISELEKMASTFQAGRLLREGLKVAFAGRPNVGKSSLFNALLGNNRAIVTSVPGTTRDSLHERLSINGIPISLIDTAGIRETDDEVETIGVERSRQTLADADLVLIVLDNSEELTSEDFDVIGQAQKLKHIFVVNKTDLNHHYLDTSVFHNDAKFISVSAKTGDGIETLKSAIIEPFSTDTSETSGFLITDARHADLLNRAKTELKVAKQLIESKASEEISLIGLHNALQLLGQITGETTTEDMLTRIFSTFCIGK